MTVLQALEDGVKRADADPSVKAVMICGENGKFSAGKTFFIKHSPRKRGNTLHPLCLKVLCLITMLIKVLIWLEMATRQ